MHISQCFDAQLLLHFFCNHTQVLHFFKRPLMQSVEVPPVDYQLCSFNLLVYLYYFVYGADLIFAP